MATKREEATLRQIARDTFIPGADEIQDYWDPITKDECRLMEEEELHSIGDLFINSDNDF